MADLPWSKFFWADWESDQALRLCSLAAQGLWMRMLCVCARSEPYGYLAINDRGLDVSDIARLAGVTPTEANDLVIELERNGVFSRDRKGRIHSRRLVRDKKRSEEGRKHKKRGLAEAAEKKAQNPPPSRGPTRWASTPEARSQKPEEDLYPAAAPPGVPREPEGEQQQDLRLRLMAECGVPPEPCPQYWRPHSADARIQRWRDELGLSDEQILSVAEAQRAAAARRGLDPPDGPKALQAAMEAAAGRPDAPKASEEAVLRKFEDWAKDPSKRNLVPKAYLARIEGQIAT